jgi:hypothetical protein
MIIRIILLVIAAYMHLEYFDSYYTQNLADGMYASEADSIGIPIITSQLMTLAAVFFSSPIVLLGNKSIREKLGSTKILFSLPSVVIFLFCYLLILGFSYLSASDILMPKYRAIAVDAIWLFLVPLIFLVIDAVRLSFYVRSLGSSEIPNKFN